MGISVSDLPPKYQEQALRKWADAQRKKGRGPLPFPVDVAPINGRKYHNTPTERVTVSGNVLRFDSQKEARRYDELAALERAGKIRDLRMQVDFTLQEAYTDREGRRERAIRYRADFTYEKRIVSPPVSTDFAGKKIELIKGQAAWVPVVEDVKSRACEITGGACMFVLPDSKLCAAVCTGKGRTPTKSNRDRERESAL